MSLGPDTISALANLSSRIQLKTAVVLLIEANVSGMEVLTQILMGFGATRLLKATSFEEAQARVQGEPLDLILCDAVLQPDGSDGYDFVHWLRRAGLDPNSFAPVIVTASHTSLKNVARARDCGAHFVVQKPLSPRIVLERLLWVAQTNRTFISCDSYAGPDRRFHNLGPPNGVGRRADDLSEDVGVATEPNMDQHQIDALVVPKRAAV